jgi:hypothetical protein
MYAWLQKAIVRSISLWMISDIGPVERGIELPNMPRRQRSLATMLATGGPA